MKKTVFLTLAIVIVSMNVYSQTNEWENPLANAINTVQNHSSLFHYTNENDAIKDLGLGSENYVL